MLVIQGKYTTIFWFLNYAEMPGKHGMEGGECWAEIEAIYHLYMQGMKSAHRALKKRLLQNQVFAIFVVDQNIAWFHTKLMIYVLIGRRTKKEKNVLLPQCLTFLQKSCGLT